MSARRWFRLQWVGLVFVLVGPPSRGTEPDFRVSVGLELRRDVATDQLFVLTPIKGSPAYKAKVRTGDVITAITTRDRWTDETASPIRHLTWGMPLRKASRLLLGDEGTTVKLTIQRKGGSGPFDVEIARGPYSVEMALGSQRKANDDWDFLIDPNHKIGYIRLIRFGRNSWPDTEAVMKNLVKQGVKGLVLDLRFNPGGPLDPAIRITDLYIDDGLIVSIRPRGGADKEARFDGQHKGSLLEFPMVCLINGQSASASEIVSAALQDHKRALIIGERSRGKGSAQNIRDFEVTDPKTGEEQRAEIKLTTAAFYRPNGKCLDRLASGKKNEWGVTPDKVIPLTAKERGELADHLRSLEIIRRPGQRSKPNPFKDRQLDAALEHLRSRIKMASRGGASKAG